MTAAETLRVLKRAEAALKPFADRVFNDNGDCTVSDMHTLSSADYVAAQIAHRILADAILALRK